MFSYSDLLGVKYIKGGRDSKGVDCYGLVQILHNRMGKNLPEYATPDDKSLIFQLVNSELNRCVKLDEPEAGCIVLFKFTPFEFHMGTVLPDKQRFIHILENRNVAVEKLSSRIWSKLLVGYYRWEV